LRGRKEREKSRRPDLADLGDVRRIGERKAHGVGDRKNDGRQGRLFLNLLTHRYTKREGRRKEKRKAPVADLLPLDQEKSQRQGWVLKNNTGI